MKNNILIIICSLIISIGCEIISPSEKLIQTAIIETKNAKPTNTSYTSPNPQINDTEKTANPNEKSPTLTATIGIDTSFAKAKNYITNKEIGGVIVEIARIVIVDKKAAPVIISNNSIYDNSQTLVEFIFRIINNSGRTIDIFCDQAIISINGEQIDASEFIIGGGTKFGDDVDGQFLPDVTSIGGYWIGIKRTPWNKINKIIIKITRPIDHQNSSFISDEDYYFEIEIEKWTFENIPNELK